MKTPPLPARRSRLRVSSAWLSALLMGFASMSPLHAEEDFDKTSLALRTALHYDPLVDAPLHQLAELYRKASRLEELLGLYESHVSQYPQDAGAALVLARLYMEAKDRRAAEYWKNAVARHPADAALTWFHAKFMEEHHDPKALDEMARAVSLEASASRRALWYAELMKAAAGAGREELVISQTKKFLSDGSMTPEQRLRWARQAMGVKLRHTAKLLMEGLAPETLSADNALEAAMLRAELLAAEGARPEAVKTLDDMLGKLAPDHWRRHEMLMLRLDLSDASGRDTLIKSARDEWAAPGGKTEAHALALADLLEAAHRGHESFLLLRDAEAALPESHNLEKRLLETWENEGITPEALQWLDSILAKQKDRADLELRRVRWLFTASKNEDAKQAFEKLLKILTPEQRVERGVEMARWLRRRNQLPEAASVLESALVLAPDRWDLRRELAEMDFALRRKEEAAKLFEGEWTKNLAPDARLETVQFLISKQLWTEARALLEPWLKEQSGAFEGRLVLARIFVKTGDDARASEVLDVARKLCDTPERYQAWLSASLDFAEARERIAEWIRHEAELLQADVTGTWNETTMTRWLALLAEARSHREEKLAAELLTTLSQNAKLSPDKKTEMERLRLDLLATDAANVSEVERGLRALMDTDAPHSEDYRARLALLYQRSQRNDLSRPLLEQLDPSRCTELETLRALVPVCQQQGFSAQALAAAEKLTELEPGEKSHWTQRLTLLAESGNEERFRATLRLVQSKAPDWKLKPEVLEMLDAHWLSSAWRDVLSLMTGTETDLASARRVLEEAQHAGSGSPEQMRWMDWISAFLSAKLHDRAAAENALAKLEVLDPQQWIAFPDGLELSVSEGRRRIKDQIAKEAAPGSGGVAPSLMAAGPMGPWALRWGFALESGRSLVRTLAPVGSPLVFFIDDQRSIHAVNRGNGKLVWTTRSRSAPVAAVPKTNSSARVIFRGGSRYYNPNQAEFLIPLEAVTNGQQFCALRDNEVQCLNAADGTVLWNCRLADAEEAASPMGKRDSRLALAGNKVVVWQPDPSVVSAYELRSGRLLWEARVPQRQAPNIPNNPYGNPYYGFDPSARIRSGLSVADGKVFVFSDTAAMMNLENGAMLWRLATAELPGFPIDLETQDSATPGSPGSPLTPQTLVPFTRFSSVTLTSSGAGGVLTIIPPAFYSPFYGRARMMQAGGMGAMGRWAFGNSFATTLSSAYGAVALLHGDEVWTLVSNNPGFVSVMGLPRRLVQNTGTVVGFAGDSLIAFDNSTVQAHTLRENGTRILLNVAGADPATNANLGSPPIVSVAVVGSRVYECDGSSMHVLEAREGATLFEGHLPADLTAWVKSLPEPPPPALPPGYTPAMWRAQNPNGNRSYLPQGIFTQDNRGGGMLTAPLAAVVDGDWIFPVGENAVACVHGQAEEPTHAPRS